MFDMQMEMALTNLKAEMVSNYESWQNLSGKPRTEIQASMLDEYINTIRFEEGRKYIKVITRSSVWGFIVKGKDAKFKPGDILMAAGWSAPARNKARGNILTGDLTKVRWTGPEYLI
jgi:O-glycosyl hydrolase